MKYYSQYKQDMFADFIPNKDKGVFLDIGANDGISYSNSYFFEKTRKWNGICIEPIPETFKKLQEVRSCTCLNCGVWSEEKIIKFYRAHGYAEMLSGIIDSFNDQHFKRLKESIEAKGGQLEIIDINVYTLNNLLQKNNITHIDFCSIDTEGSEYEILKAVDFDKYHFELFAIENQYNPETLRAFMNGKGFQWVYRLGGDDIFINKKIANTFKVKSRILKFKIFQKLRRFKRGSQKK